MAVSHKVFCVSIAFLFGLTAAFGQQPISLARIPKVSHPPKMKDFLNNTPREAELKVTYFRQIDPGDGDPVSQPTTAYLSYDEKNLYVAFICLDDPGKIRAQIARRDSIFSDDRVNISIDTFHDHLRNYWFEANPYGLQMDGTIGRPSAFCKAELSLAHGKKDRFQGLQKCRVRRLRNPGNRPLSFYKLYPSSPC